MAWRIAVSSYVRMAACSYTINTVSTLDLLNLSLL